MTNSGKLQSEQVEAEQLQTDEARSIVVDSQSPCMAADDAEALVERNYAAVYRYAYRLAGCQATAEDIAQDVFVKAIAHFNQLRSGDAERGWLLTITRREFVRWLRQVARPAHGRTGPLDDQAAVSTDPNSAAQTLDNQDWVQAALGQLNEDARVALLMYYFEDLSYAEIAQQLQIPIGTVMSRLSRGRDHLRQGLERLARPQSPSGTCSTPGPLHSHVTGPQNDSKPSAQEAHHG